MIQIIKLKDGTTLISQIEEIKPLEYGAPNTKLTNPFVLPSYKRWLSEYTDETFLLIDDDNILTLADPKEIILERYKKDNGIVDTVEYIEEEDEEEEHY